MLHEDNSALLPNERPTVPLHLLQRPIPTQSEKVLDAPDLVDDYYLNLLDWGNNNTLAIALGRSVYLWDANTGKSCQLYRTSLESNIITSVSFAKQGNSNYLAIGTNDAEIQIWDLERVKAIRTMTGHAARVSTMDWNQHILSSGSRDSMIFHHDVRVASHIVGTLEGHTQEVCGLKWSPDGTQLASGGTYSLPFYLSIEYM